MFENGDGVIQNYAEAAKWYRRAAQQGHAYAQNSLAIMYDRGWGVPEDDIEAHKWYNLSAAAGNRVAGKNRSMLATEMTREQIAEAQRRAKEWRPTPE